MVPGPAQFMEENAVAANTKAQSKKKLSLDVFIVGRPFMAPDELMSIRATFNSW
jgi:hypothetical protein